MICGMVRVSWQLFDEFGKAVLGSLDELAERVRMIGQDPLDSPEEMLMTASVKVAARGQTMREMIHEADTNLMIVIKEIRAGARVADQQDDPGTVDLFSDLCKYMRNMNGGCATYLNSEMDLQS